MEGKPKVIKVLKPRSLFCEGQFCLNKPVYRVTAWQSNDSIELCEYHLKAYGFQTNEELLDSGYTKKGRK